jgi:hypothetical protein
MTCNIVAVSPSFRRSIFFPFLRRQVFASFMLSDEAQTTLREFGLEPVPSTNRPPFQKAVRDILVDPTIDEFTLETDTLVVAGTQPNVLSTKQYSYSVTMVNHFAREFDNLKNDLAAYEARADARLAWLTEKAHEKPIVDPIMLGLIALGIALASLLSSCLALFFVLKQALRRFRRRVARRRQEEEDEEEAGASEARGGGQRLNPPTFASDPNRTPKLR